MNKYEFGDSPDVEVLRHVAIILLLGRENVEEIIEAAPLQLGSQNLIYERMVECANKQKEECKEIILNLLDDSKKLMGNEDLPIDIFTQLCQFSDSVLHKLIAKGMECTDAIRDRNINITNEEIINSFVIELFKTYNGKSVLNVDCEVGTFILREFDESKTEVTGFCADDIDYHVAKARGYILNNKAIHVEKRNLFESGNEMYDKIYLTYPFNANYDIKSITPIIFSLKCASNLELGRKYSPSMLGIICMLENLKENGIMVALVPEGGLVNSIDNDIRKILVYSNYIVTIMTLPSEIVSPSVGIMSYSLLILKKNRMPDEDIICIDVEKMFHDLNRGNKMQLKDIKKWVELVSNQCTGEYKFSVERKNIISENCYLGLKRYKVNPGVINPIEMKKVSNLILRGCQLKSNEFRILSTEKAGKTNYRLVNMSDITAEGYVKSNLTPVQIDEPKKFDKFCLEPGDLVITAKNTTFKSAVYEPEEDIKAVMTGNLIAIRLDQKKVNPYFLKAFLDSDGGQNALASVQTGTTLKTLTVNNLAVMRVSCPSMETQEKIAAAYKSKLSEVKEYIAKYEKAVDDLKNIYQKEV